MRGRKRIYRISIDDESSLSRVASATLTPVQIALIVPAMVTVLFVIAGAVIMLTPLKTLLPGYMKEAQRSHTIETLMRLDSLQEANRRNEAFLSNVINVLDTERTSSDSVRMVINKNPLTVDSLLPRSDAEERFVRNMEEKERYNISILAPLAAEGMLFTPVSDESVITEKSRERHKAEIRLATSSPVSCIADGIVVDRYFSRRDGGMAVIIQHSKGFMSRYSRLGSTLVEPGDRVSSGQIIALPPVPSGIDNTLITIEMWRNGFRLIPSHYIGDTPRDSGDGPVVDEDVGRGR